MIHFKKISQVALYLLQESYTKEAHMLLQGCLKEASPREEPIPAGTSSLDVIEYALKKNRDTNHSFIELRNLFKKEKVWEPFQNQIKGQAIKYLTFWVKDIMSLVSDMKRSRFWDITDLPESNAPYIFMSDPVGPRDLVILVAFNLAKKTIALSVRTLEEISSSEAEEEETLSKEELWEAFLEDDLPINKEVTLEDFKKLADANDVDYKIKTFPKNKKKIILFSYNGESYIVYDLEAENLEVSTTESWLDSNMYNAEDYVFLSTDLSLEYFWDTPAPLYHAADEDNVEEIMQRGLVPMSVTRGITNRQTSAAVFTSVNPEAIDSYGNTVFEIDTEAMKRDGYTPEVGLEPGIEEYEYSMSLARFVENDDYIIDEPSDGVDLDTVIVFGKIPAKYLSLPFA